MPKGSAHGHFQRALERRHLLSAEAAARQLGHVSLADALALCLLMVDQAPERFDLAAARWHARLVLETRGMALTDSQLALAALAALGGPGRAQASELLRALTGRFRVPNVDSAFRHLPDDGHSRARPPPRARPR